MIFDLADDDSHIAEVTTYSRGTSYYQSSSSEVKCGAL